MKKGLAAVFLLPFCLNAQDGGGGQEGWREAFKRLDHRLDQVEKAGDELHWFLRLQDIAWVDKVRMTGPPLVHEEGGTGLGEGNPWRFYAYTFLPRDHHGQEKLPLLLFPHGGVHSHFSSYYLHIVRELLWQGYAVIAADYRGSTGYGQETWEAIDYGGREIEDVHEGRAYMLENFPFLDGERVGILGWSHGGLITLMNLFRYPDDFAVGFAGVPVSDLIMRMGYYGEAYRSLYSAKHHIGKTANEDIEAYKRRSPVWNVSLFRDTPLLIHGNTSDEDVSVVEVEHLIQALKAEGKKFDYRIFDGAPGGHSFDRLDTRQARSIRVDIYRHLAQKLRPPRPIGTLKDLYEAAVPGSRGS